MFDSLMGVGSINMHAKIEKEFNISRSPQFSKHLVELSQPLRAQWSVDDERRRADAEERVACAISGMWARRLLCGSRRLGLPC